MTKSVTITASESPYWRNAESVGYKCSVPNKQANRLREFSKRTSPNSGDFIHTHKASSACLQSECCQWVESTSKICLCNDSQECPLSYFTTIATIQPSSSLAYVLMITSS